MAIKTMSLTKSDVRLIKTWSFAGNPHEAMIEKLPHLTKEFLKGFSLLEMEIVLRKFEEIPDLEVYTIPYIVDDKVLR